MNRNLKNFWLDVVLFVAFVVVIVSSFALDSDAADLGRWGLGRSFWLTVHAIAGLAMLVGSGLHLGWHWDWVKAALKPGGGTRSRSMRRNRMIDVLLFISLIAVSFTGLILWPMAARVAGDHLSAVTLRIARPYHGLASLHALSAIVITILAAAHLAFHWKWIASTVRRCMATRAEV